MSLSPEEWTTILLSLRVALLATLICFPVGLGLAWLLARKEFWGKAILNSLIHLPLVLPPVVMGYLLLITFGTRAPLGAWLLQTFGIRFVFSWTGAALAAAVVTFPFQVRAIRLALDVVDGGLEAAAESLGAGRVDRFFSITLPLILPGIIAGAITAFAASLGEFGAIITFVSNVPGETRTLPLAIYTAIQTPGGEQAAARLAAISIVLALTGLVLSEIAARKVRQMTGR